MAKLAAARKHKRFGKCEGRKSHREKRPEVVALARKLCRKRPKGGQLSFVCYFEGTSRTGLSQRARGQGCGEHFERTKKLTAPFQQQRVVTPL